MPAPNRRTKIINVRGPKLALEANKSLFEDGELCFATDEVKYYVKYGTDLVAVMGDEGFSGDYDDLTNKPVIPSATSELTNDSNYITAAEAPVQTSDLPTAVSELTNDANYITAAEAPVQPSDVFSGSYSDLTGSPDLTLKADLVGGKLQTSQIPDLAVTEYKGDVADETAMLAVSGEKGDWVTRQDDGRVYIITGDDPTSVTNWAAITYPASAVQSVAGKTGVVTLDVSDIAGVTLQSVTDAGNSTTANIQAGKFIGGSSSTGETLLQNGTGSVTLGSVYAFGTTFLGSGVKSGTSDPYTFECTFTGNAQRVAYTQETTGAAATTGHSFWGAISKNNIAAGAIVTDMKRRFYLDTKDTTIFLGPDLDLTQDPATQATIQLIGSNGSAVFDSDITSKFVKIRDGASDEVSEAIRFERSDIPAIRYHSIQAIHSGNSAANLLSFYLHTGGSDTTGQVETMRLKGDGSAVFNTSVTASEFIGGSAHFAGNTTVGNTTSQPRVFLGDEGFAYFADYNDSSFAYINHPSDGALILNDTANSSGAKVAIEKTGNATFAGDVSAATFIGSKIESNGLLWDAPTIENVYIDGTTDAFASSNDVNIADGNVHYFTDAESAEAVNTVNLRWDGSNSLDSKLSVGHSLSTTLIVASTDTTRAPSVIANVQIDGSTVTPLWQGNSAAPEDDAGGTTSGDNKDHDVYSLTIIKTASAAFTVLAARVRYGLVPD